MHVYCTCHSWHVAVLIQYLNVLLTGFVVQQFSLNILLSGNVCVFCIYCILLFLNSTLWQWYVYFHHLVPYHLKYIHTFLRFATVCSDLICWVKSSTGGNKWTRSGGFTPFVTVFPQSLWYITPIRIEIEKYVFNIHIILSSPHYLIILLLLVGLLLMLLSKSKCRMCLKYGSVNQSGCAWSA